MARYNIGDFQKWDGCEDEFKRNIKEKLKEKM